MPNPTCAANCDVNLPVVNFDDCNPQVNYSEIRRIFIAKKGAVPFVNWLSAAEWLTRMSQSTTIGDDYIRALTVIADKPAAASVIKEISNGRRIVIGKDHTINFTIDDVSDENYEFMRGLECGGEYRFWYETEGGKMFGGNDGFLSRLDANSVLNRGRDEIETISGVMTWRTKFSPERGDSPIFSNGTGGAPTIYDTSLAFGASTSDDAEGVAGEVAAIDADLLFEFNAITPQVGTPMTMTINVAAVLAIVIDFTSDYQGEYYRFTDKDGDEHVGTFTNGTVNF